MGKPAASKQKRGSAELQSDLSDTLATFKTELAPHIFFTKEALLKWFNDDPSNVYSLFLSGTTHGPRMTSFTVPKVFRRFEINRGKDYKVEAITDGTSTINGEELVPLALIENMQTHCYDNAYFSLDAPMWMLGFKEVLLMDDVHTIPKTEEEIDVVRIFTFDAQTASYASAKTILRVLSYDYVKVEDFKNVAVAVSAAEKLGLDIDEIDLSEPTKLSAQLKKTDAEVSVQALTQTLYASYIKDLDLEGKIQAFTANPSPRLASLIDLKMPTKLTLVHTSNKSPVQATPLSKLAEDDDIILSNVAISQEFYQQVIVAGDVQVVKLVKNLSVKNRNNKLAPLKEPETMKVKDFRKIVAAIEEDNKASGTAGTASASSTAVDTKKLASFFQS